MNHPSIFSLINQQAKKTVSFLTQNKKCLICCSNLVGDPNDDLKFRGWAGRGCLTSIGLLETGSWLGTSRTGPVWCCIGRKIFLKKAKKNPILQEKSIFCQKKTDLGNPFLTHSPPFSTIFRTAKKKYRQGSGTRKILSTTSEPSDFEISSNFRSIYAIFRGSNFSF